MQSRPTLQRQNLRTTEEAAKHLGMKKGTLEVWRVQGRGPRFLKLGRSVRYPEEFLNDFINMSIRRSTSK